MPKQIATSILVLATALRAVGQAQVHVGPRVPEPASIRLPGDDLTVPMQDLEGRPVIDVKINGKGPYRFLFDTGALTTVISDDLSRELSLMPAAGVAVAPAGDGPAPAIVLVHDVRIGDAVLEGVIAAVLPLGGLLRGENAPRGVLSAASFPGYLVIFDYPGKHISIKQGALESANAKSTFQYTQEQALPSVPIRIAGHETQVHLDTGSPFGLTLPAKFLRELPLASQPKQAGRVRTGGGEFPVSVARVNGSVELGKYTLDLDEVRFSDARPGPGPAAGNIGYGVLRHFVVTLDSKNRRIQLGGMRPLLAQNAGKLPSVNEVLERYVEATGGREALLRHKSMTVHGRYQDPAHKADYETVFYTKDGKMLLQVELGGGKQYQTGYDGATAWVLHPDGKADLSEGDMVKTVARDADMYYHLHVLNYFKSMEVVDVKEFNGRLCYHLKGINKWGKVNEHFYDTESGFLMGYAFNTAWRGGKGDATDSFEEYQDFGGVRMATKTTSRDGDDLTISLISAVTYDDVKDDVFALPKAVKAAVAEKRGHTQ